MKIYKGYELMKMLSEGKIDINQKVSTLSLDYEKCTIGFVIKDRAERIMNLSFELIEDEINIQEIEELEIGETTEERLKINKLIQIVKQLDKKLEESKK